jgi:hypothetical protein
MSASTAISCSGDAAAVNSCYSSHLSSFNTQLDWAIFGPADTALHTGMWTASSGGMTVDVSAPNTSGAEGLRLADNYSRILSGGVWMQAYNLPSPPYSFPGHFDSQPDAGAGSPGDHLMGLRLDGTNALGAMMINFNSPLTDLAFRMASTTSSLFNANVQIFSGINGGGTLLGQLNLSGLTGGGVCPGLNMNPPVPCNDAPWLAFLAQSGIRSVSISSSDPTGFYIGHLYVGNGSIVTTAPEPASLILCGCGAALLFFGKKRRQRS